MGKVYKILLIVFILGSLLIYNITSNDKTENVSVKIDGEEINYDKDYEPFIENSTTYISLTNTAYLIAAELIDNDDESLGTIIYNDTVLDITADGIFRFEQGVATNLNATPIIRGEEVYLPARILLESFGYNIAWDKESKTIYATNINKVSSNENPYVYGELSQTDYQYQGILFNGIPDIRGQIQFNNGNVYKGGISQSIISGAGIQVYQDGDIFKGTFNNGLRNGVAEYTDYNNATVCGIWNSGNLNGEVTILYSDGAKYIGNLSAGKRNGEGTFYFANGDNYTGKWAEDEFDGKGVYVFSNGSSFEGTWKDGELNGIVYYKSGAQKYRCKYENGKVINVEGSN